MATKTVDYQAIAKARMSRPNPGARKPNYLVYGKNKKGKTTFGHSAPRTMIIDPEHGTSEIQLDMDHIWPVTKWADLDSCVGFLRSGGTCPDPKCPEGRGHPFDWVSVDGMTRINQMALKHVMRVQEERSLDRIPGLVQQRDYGKSGELMKELITDIHALNLGTIFTAQERMSEGSDSEEDEEAEESGIMYIPDLPRGVRGHLNALVDVIGRIYVVKVEVRGELTRQRRLWIGESLKYDTGYRSAHELPDFLRNPTVPRLTHLVREGTLSRRTA